MITALVEIIICSGLLYLCYVLFLRNRACHHFNRFYLLSMLLIPVAIPFIHIPVAAGFLKDISTGGTAITGFVSVNGDTTRASGTGLATGNIILLAWSLYGAFVVILLFRILISLLRIVRLLRKYHSEKKASIHFIRTNENDAPFSFHKWLFWHNEIDVDSDLGQQILRHEIVHIRQNHSADIMVSEILCALFWINPFFWLAKKELKTVHEFLADAIVTRETDKALYANLLLQHAMSTEVILGHQFFGNHVLRRIRMIGKSAGKRSFYLRKVTCILLATCIILFFSFDTIGKEIKTYAMQAIPAKIPAAIGDREMPGAAVQPGNREEMKSIAFANSKLQQVPAALKIDTVQSGKLKSNELSVLNYHNDAIAYSISMPADNIVPGFVKERNPVTQVILATSVEENGTDETVFFPAQAYNELVLIFNKNKGPLPGNWKLLVYITDEKGNTIPAQVLSPEKISGYEAVRISFNNIPKGIYHLQLKSTDAQYISYCKVVRDYD